MLCLIVVERTGRIVAGRGRVARSWWGRVRGLVGRRRLEAGEALIIPRCRSIHTCGMRFPIDIIMVDRAWRVVAVHPGVAPWRLLWPAWRAWGAIEAAAGVIQRCGIQVGDQLRVVEAA